MIGVSLREKLDQKRPVFGTHIAMENIMISDIFGEVKYDYFWIDMEHTGMRTDQVLSHIVAANGAGVSAVVRVPWNDPVLLKPVLEMGPDAIVIPMVCSGEEAERAVAACTYPTKGIRGWGPKRAIRYGNMDKNEYLDSVEKRTMRLLQIEHVHALEELDDIVNVLDVDGFIIGPMDLAASAGMLRETCEEQIDDWIEKIIVTVHNAGKIVGISIGSTSVERLQRWIFWGMDMISMGGDIRYLLKGAQNNLRILQKACKK